MLVGMRVLEELAAALGLGEMIVLVNHRAAAHLLERTAFDVAGRKRLGEIMRLVAAHGRHMLGGEHLAIDRTPRDRVLGIAEELFPEAFFAAIVEAQVAAHARAMLHQEADQAAEMVAVGVAEDQAIDLGGVDVEQIGVAQNDLGRIAEIQHVLCFGAGAVGLEMQ